MAMPIVVFQKNNAIHLGTVIIVIDPNISLYPAIKSWPIPNETGEALLVHRDGNEVVYLNELRHIKNTSLMMRYPLTEMSLPAVKAVLGWKGVVEGIDYRKKNVLAAIKAVPDSNWFLIAKVDTEEIYAPLTERFWVTVFFILVTYQFLESFLLISGVISRRNITANNMSWKIKELLYMPEVSSKRVSILW